ncbi:hypothetical protein [Pelagibacterium sp.]|uniref:hypothetical protein n=1 Tax=Pelagibacterium sp. TaxID=1967288 RepID=UPI003BAD436D
MKEESALLGIDNLYLIGGLSPSNLAVFHRQERGQKKLQTFPVRPRDQKNRTTLATVLQPIGRSWPA